MRYIPMTNTFKATIPNIACFFIMLFFLFTPAWPAVGSPWELNQGESVVVGVLLSLNSDVVRIQTPLDQQDFPLAHDALFALMGRQSGRLVPLLHFPAGIEVELYINPSGAVRAIRNRQAPLRLPEGKPLQGWGHQASLSPDGKKYLLYHRETGINLYSTINRSQTPQFLADSSVADWSANGEIAVGLPDKIIIYNIRAKAKKTLPLPALPPGTSRVIADLKWNCAGNKILYAAVESWDHAGSDLCSLAVMDKNGRLLGSKAVVHLGPAVWLDNSLVAYISYQNMDGDRGRIMTWNHISGQEGLLQGYGDDEGCTGLAYDPANGVLAVTAKNLAGENLYLIKTANEEPALALSWPFPLRNLQWSPGGALFFWDEYNNCIYELQNDNRTAIPRAAGYLPPAGTGKAGFVYFLAEPLEEPQQIFFIDDGSTNR